MKKSKTTLIQVLVTYRIKYDDVSDKKRKIAACKDVARCAKIEGIVEPTNATYFGVAKRRTHNGKTN